MRARWLAVIAGWAGMAAAAGCHHSEAQAHAGRDQATVSAASGTHDALAGKRRHVVGQLNKTLAEVDEQIEMLDAIIEGREDTRDFEDEHEGTTAIYDSMYETRAALAAQRERAVAGIQRVRTASEDRWLEESWSARMEMGELEASYDTAVKSLYR